MNRKEGNISDRKLIFDKEGVEAFAEQFRIVRRNAGFTQQQLAFESGISLSQIARIETAKINPTISTIFVLARTMEVEAEEFFKFKILNGQKDRE